MTAFMVVRMNISEQGWIDRYFAEVPRLLAEYGGVSVAGAREVRRVEGEGPVPDRVAVLSFPSVEAIDRFLADPRYQVHRAERQAGSASDIVVFENSVTGGELV